MSKIRHCYTEKEIQWMMYYGQCKRWKHIGEFCDAFNKKFDLTIDRRAFETYLRRHGISVNADSKDALYTEEQVSWIEQNLSNGLFDDLKHFTDTFNAIFNESKGYNTMSVYLYKHGLKLQTKRNRRRYTDEQIKWLKVNSGKYSTFQDCVDDFNNLFGTEHSFERLRSYCISNGWCERKKKTDSNRGQWKKGGTHQEECPIGTIRYQNNKPYIKVKMCNGKSRAESENNQHHGLKEPFWKPLQKKIWEDHYGEVPKGYVVCSLNGDRADENIKNIGIIDKRYTGVMGSKGWWTENSVITGDGVMWCNLYATAKDHGVKFNRR